MFSGWCRNPTVTHESRLNSFYSLTSGLACGLTAGQARLPAFARLRLAARFACGGRLRGSGYQRGDVRLPAFASLRAWLAAAQTHQVGVQLEDRTTVNSTRTGGRAP